MFGILETIPIETTKMSMTFMTSRVAHLQEVVWILGMNGHLMTISRLLIGTNFSLEILIVFEILYSYNTNG